MSALDYAVTRIRRDIPEEILHETLNIGQTRTAIYSTSLDFKIKQRILKDIVMRETKLMRGVERIVSLAGIQCEFDDYNAAIFNIPPERTDDREIIAVYGIAPVPLMLSDNGMGGNMPNLGGNVGADANSCGTSAWQRVANKVKRSHDVANINLNVITSIVGYNTVEIQGLKFFNNMNLGLRCEIAYDDKLSTLKSAAYRNFGHLSVLAAKLYIYNTLIVKMGIGKLDFGEDLGVFTEIVNGYSDMGEEFYRYLSDEWRRTLIHDEPGAIARHLKSRLHIGF